MLTSTALLEWRPRPELAATRRLRGRSTRPRCVTLRKTSLITWCCPDPERVGLGGTAADSAPQQRQVDAAWSSVLSDPRSKSPYESNHVRHSLLAHGSWPQGAGRRPPESGCAPGRGQDELCLVLRTIDHLWCRRKFGQSKSDPCPWSCSHGNAETDRRRSCQMGGSSATMRRSPASKCSSAAGDQLVPSSKEKDFS